MRVTLIYNPDAGGDHQPSGDDLLELIHKAGHSATFHSSTDAGWEKALQEAADVVAVAGGDGMVGQVAKRMIGTRVPIAILPMGTADNVATMLGVKDRALDQLIFGWNFRPAGKIRRRQRAGIVGIQTLHRKLWHGIVYQHHVAAGRQEQCSACSPQRHGRQINFGIADPQKRR